MSVVAVHSVTTSASIYSYDGLHTVKRYNSTFVESVTNVNEVNTSSIGGVTPSIVGSNIVVTYVGKAAESWNWTFSYEVVRVQF